MILSIGWRSKFLWIIVVIMFGCLVAKLQYLMTDQHGFLEHQGNIRSSRLNIEQVSRGVVYDRNHKILAQSLPSAKAWLAAKNLSWYKKNHKIIDLALNSEFKNVIGQYRRNKKNLLLNNMLSPEELMWVENNYSNIIRLDKFDKRYYPLQDAAAPILGLVNINGFGQEGVELAYDDVLQSHYGKIYVEKNRKGAVVKLEKVIDSSKQSQGLVLSIDSEIQKMAYDILRSGVERVGAESGVAIILDPKTGEIHAITNFPSFNPNNTSVINFSNIKNRAVTDLFEPGSTIKPITIAAALESKAYKTTDVVDTGDGTMDLYGHKIEDEFHKHGLLTITEILKKSSNVGISKIAMALNPNLLPSLLEKFGFTKYNLFLPGESPGHINSKAWQPGIEHATLAFGYGIAINALQLAHAYTIIANDGVDSGIYITKEHPVKKTRIISKQVATDLRAMLTHVTDYGGTASAAKINGVAVAGKTGTARIASSNGYKKSYISSFIGMFPAENPSWVILVVVKRPNLRYYFGGQSAAPIFSKIGSELLRFGLINRRIDLPDY